jgi:hypothetical protein
MTYPPGGLGSEYAAGVGVGPGMVGASNGASLSISRCHRHSPTYLRTAKSPRRQDVPLGVRPDRALASQATGDTVSRIRATEGRNPTSRVTPSSSR